MINVLLEAMAFGLPVITRPVGDMKDFFQQGQMGFITDSKDPQVLADYIRALAVDLELRKRISIFIKGNCQNHRIDSTSGQRSFSASMLGFVSWSTLEPGTKP